MTPTPDTDPLLDEVEALLALPHASAAEEAGDDDPTCACCGRPMLLDEDADDPEPGEDVCDICAQDRHGRAMALLRSLAARVRDLELRRSDTDAISIARPDRRDAAERIAALEAALVECSRIGTLAMEEAKDLTHALDVIRADCERAGIPGEVDVPDPGSDDPAPIREWRTTTGLVTIALAQRLTASQEACGRMGHRDGLGRDRCPFDDLAAVAAWTRGWDEREAVRADGVREGREAERVEIVAWLRQDADESLAWGRGPECIPDLRRFYGDFAGAYRVAADAIEQGKGRDLPSPAAPPVAGPWTWREEGGGWGLHLGDHQTDWWSGVAFTRRQIIREARRLRGKDVPALPRTGGAS